MLNGPLAVTLLDPFLHSFRPIHQVSTIHLLMVFRLNLPDCVQNSTLQSAPKQHEACLSNKINTTLVYIKDLAESLLIVSSCFCRHSHRGSTSRMSSKWNRPVVPSSDSDPVQ
jgi:hypothetical protein